jgi:nitrogen fixation protein NifB
MSTRTDSSGQSDQADWFHPCYYEEAHRRYARMHLPVAPRCNVQCRFCNRDYDCVNETRPGVTSRILSPDEALTLVDRVSESTQPLAVVGIAGPGDSLANDDTFETLWLLRERHPDLALCLATNGLLLPSNVDELASLGVEFVTVTVNALDPTVGARIYSMVRHEGRTLSGKRAFELLSSHQWEGIRECVKRGIVVKINSVLIPGVNESEMQRIAEKSRETGVDVMNIIPFIPVEGSEFEDVRAPSRSEVVAARDQCRSDVRQITHCARCRADAIGLLGCDASSEFYKDL